MLQKPTNHGVSLFLVLAALVVTALIGSAMFKLATGGQLANASYSTSATARSAAQSGITAAVQKLEQADPKSTIIPILQHWIDAYSGGAALTETDRWLRGSSTTFQDLNGDMKFRTQITGFDMTNFNISLRSEGKGKGGAKAVTTAVYHVEGLELITSRYPANAIQADGGLHECNSEKLIINGGTSINWSGAYSMSSLNTKAVFNGTFRSDNATTPFKLNDNYEFRGKSYFNNIEILNGGGATCFQDWYVHINSSTTSGINTPVAASGSSAQEAASLAQLGLPASPDPAIHFINEANLTSYILPDDPVEADGAWMNTLWENTPANKKYKGKYIVLKVERTSANSWKIPFKNTSNIPFKYQAIIIVKGKTNLKTFYQSSDNSVSVVYIDSYPSEYVWEKTFTDISLFRGFLHVNSVEQQGSANHITIGKDYPQSPAMIADISTIDQSYFIQTFKGSIYLSENACLRFEGSKQMEYSGNFSSPNWTLGTNNNLHTYTTSTGTSFEVEMPNKTIRIMNNGKAYYPGVYTVQYYGQEEMLKEIASDGIIRVLPRAGEADTPRITLKAGINTILASLLSQVM